MRCIDDDIQDLISQVTDFPELPKLNESFTNSYSAGIFYILWSNNTPRRGKIVMEEENDRILD